MDDSYELDVKFAENPGWRRANVHVTGPRDVIAATLKQLCEHPSTALMQLHSIEVKRA